MFLNQISVNETLLDLNCTGGWITPVVLIGFLVLLGLVTLVIINLQEELDRKQKKILALELLVTDLTHNFQQEAELIKGSIRETKAYVYDLMLNTSLQYVDCLSEKGQTLSTEEDSRLIFDEETNTFSFVYKFSGEETRTLFWSEEEKDWEQELIAAPTGIYREINEISQGIQRLSDYEKRSSQFIEAIYAEKKSAEKVNRVNESVRDLARKIISKNENKYKHKVELKEIYDRNLKDVLIKDVTISIVLEKLIENSFQAFESKLNQEREFTPMLKIQTKKVIDSIEIGISDNGRGIPWPEQSKIFEPFVSVGSSYERQGIGLALVKELLILEQGDIRVESIEGEGSTFVFSLKLP